MVAAVKTNSAKVRNGATREQVLRLASQAIGRLLTEQTQRWQRPGGFDYAGDGRLARLSREHVNVAPVRAHN
jgi:hypothetical protein